MKPTFPRLACALTLALLAAAQAGAQTALDPDTRALLMTPAETQHRPEASLLLGAALAGKRVVAAGAHGVILLSDDEGKSYRQASVPVRLQLTSLFFIDEHTGWAAGQGGAILRTDDGGERWAVQRTSFESDQPLFSVYFLNKDVGWAVGLWSLMLHTGDGGKTWRRVELPVAPGQRKADLNLFKVFGDGVGNVYVACERGFVLRSSDGGKAWQYQATGYAGSLWTGVAWSDGTVLVGGLRGSLYRSLDTGHEWSSAHLGQSSSITALTKVGPNAYGVGADGLLLTSKDQGRTFAVSRRDDRVPMTAIVPTASGALLTFSKFGVPAHAWITP